MLQLQFKSMRVRAILSSLFVVSALWTIRADAQTAETHFRTGLAAFQKGDFKAARSSFAESLKLNASNKTVLHNLALTEQKLGNQGLALGVWRKALAADPSFHEAKRAIEWASKKLERPEIPHDVELWESFRSAVLVGTSLDRYLLLTAILLMATGWGIFGYLGARRRAILEERPSPPFPFLSLVFGIALIAFSGLAGAKFIDSLSVRGTVVPDKVEVRSAPDANATPLFELYEGLEVILRQTTGDWAQVSYPGGSIGWVPRQSIFATNDQVAP